MNKKTLNYSIVVAIFLALVVGGYTYWLHQKRFPSTDDAYIHAHVINIAPQVTGRVAQIAVHNQEHVKANQLLFTIDPKPFQIALEKAQANLENTKQMTQSLQHAIEAAKAQLAQNQAQLIDVQKDYNRIAALTKKGFYSKSGLDNETRALTVAKQAVVAAQNQLREAQDKLGKTGDQNAQIEAAKAAVAQAQLNLQYTTVTAPKSGQLAKFTLQPGQTVAAYQSLFSLVETNQWWAMANMKETDLERVRKGQKSIITVDMYPSHPFHGIVESISPGSGASFALLPAENATGNWVKVTQRFPVRVKITDPNKNFPLRTGASCTVVIDTTKR